MKKRFKCLSLKEIKTMLKENTSKGFNDELEDKYIETCDELISEDMINELIDIIKKCDISNCGYSYLVLKDDLSDSDCDMFDKWANDYAIAGSEEDIKKIKKFCSFIKTYNRMNDSNDYKEQDILTIIRIIENLKKDVEEILVKNAKLTYDYYDTEEEKIDTLAYKLFEFIECGYYNNHYYDQEDKKIYEKQPEYREI